jgi:TetR/AcrR family transcriptional repressor of mexJK operon
VAARAPLSTPTASSSASPKRSQILAGARRVFNELGFERASVDLIASRAGVSKATVYNHFTDKKALFVACFVEEADAMRAELRACMREPAGDVDSTLQLVGEKVLRVLLSPAVACLYRNTMAEAARFPDVGQMIFEHGPAVIYEAVGASLERWDRAGALRIDDPRSAAVQFVTLCQGDLVVRARLGILGTPTREEIRGTVERAVRTFVRAYSP